jgi:hypothetical protein
MFSFYSLLLFTTILTTVVQGGITYEEARGNHSRKSWYIPRHQQQQNMTDPNFAVTMEMYFFLTMAMCLLAIKCVPAGLQQT